MAAASVAHAAFGRMLKHWREVRRVSQLDLSLEADVSTRHLSFLETGRTRPSREMVLRLGEALELPLRDRNALLTAAGFARAYRETEWQAPELAAVREGLGRILSQQEPYPAIVMDSHWNVVMQNDGASRMMRLFPPRGEFEPPLNVLRLSFHPEGLQPYLDDWPALAARLLARLYRESSESDDAELGALYEELAGLSTVPRNWREHIGALTDTPTLELTLDNGSERCRLFTTITTFGTPQDLTLQELRIESYFPSDAATARLFAAD